MLTFCRSAMLKSAPLKLTPSRSLPDRLALLSLALYRSLLAGIHPTAHLPAAPSPSARCAKAGRHP